jgi:hypothetical protein
MDRALRQQPRPWPTSLEDADVPETTEPSLLPCSRCGESFPPDNFYKASRNHLRNQRHSWCKPCVIEGNRSRRQALVGQAKELDDERNRRYTRRKRLRKYGLTPQTYDDLLNAQGGVCAICGEPERISQPHRKSGEEPLAVDHCHKSGHVRGLLCFMCNTALGKFRDDPDLLRAAADYLERHQPAE